MGSGSQFYIRQPVFVIGYMACGKTTFGKALATETNRTFIDLDFYIEQRFHTSISDIFAAEGEESFRRKESAMLREVGEFENVIISCGGGTPCFGDNMDYMLSRGLVIFLEASEDTIIRRLSINSSRRPLMAHKSKEEMRSAVKAGLAARLQVYSRAHIRFSGDRLENKLEIDQSVISFMRLWVLDK